MRAAGVVGDDQVWLLRDARSLAPIDHLDQRRGEAIAALAGAPDAHDAALPRPLSRIAAGRVFLGIGTGNTALRSMGQPPMRIAEFAEYLRVLSGLLRGEAVDYAFAGVSRPIKMLMHEHAYMNLEPKIPLYVSG